MCIHNIFNIVYNFLSHVFPCTKTPEDPHDRNLVSLPIPNIEPEIKKDLPCPDIISNNSTNSTNEQANVILTSDPIQQSGLNDLLHEEFLHRRLLSNIIVFNSIVPYQKLWVEDNILSIDNSYFPRISRHIYGQGKNITINFIEHLVDEAIVACNKIEVPSCDKTKDLYQMLQYTLSALDTLIVTYPACEEQITAIKNKLHPILHKN